MGGQSSKCDPVSAYWDGAKDFKSLNREYLYLYVLLSSARFRDLWQLGFVPDGYNFLAITAVYT
jgi:hypothetical protein